MFKIKAATPGPFSIDLENNGCITLRPGIGFDMEQACSREWIDSDPNFQGLVKQGLIVVVYDSAKEHLPRHDFTRHPRHPDRPILPKAEEVPPSPAPEVVVSKRRPDSIIAQEGVPEVTVLEPQVEDEKVDRVIQIPIGGNLNHDQLQALDLGGVREIAHKMGLPTQFRSKANIIKAILRAQETV